MHVELNVKGYNPTALDQDRLDAAIAHLDKLTDTYRVRTLHFTIERFGRTNECQVRMVLVLLGSQRLVAVGRAPAAGPAIQKCVDILSRKVEVAKERVHRNHGERAIRRAKLESALFDLDAARQAHAARDFEGFKDALGDVASAVEAEIGRRMKFHPDADALLGDEIIIADIVDNVLWHAFEGFATKPENVPLRDWLFGLVDPAIDELVPRREAA